MGKIRFIPSKMSVETRRVLARSIGSCLISLQTEAICPHGGSSSEDILNRRAKLLKEGTDRLTSMLCAMGDPDERVNDIRFVLELMRRYNGSLDGVRALLGYASDFRQNTPTAEVWVTAIAVPLEARVAMFLKEREAGKGATEQLFANQ